MLKYHKIQTAFKRDPDNKYKTLLWGEFALPEFEYLASNEWVFTEKVDGTNIRVGWDLESVRFGGRTDRAQLSVFLFDKLQEMFKLDQFAELYPETPMTLYGEGYGARIQKGGGNYIPDGVSFILFDVMVGEHFLKREDVEDIAANLGIRCVPIYDSGTLWDAVELVRDIELESIIAWGDRLAEGLVMRPKIEMLNRRGKRIIAKIKCKDFQR